MTAKFDRKTWLTLWLMTGVLAVLVRALVAGTGRIPYDDALISFRYAWNLAHHGAWFFNAAGEKPQGATSILWVLVLSSVSPFLESGDLRAIPALQILGTLFQLGAVLLFIAAAAARPEARLRWSSAALLFALSPMIVPEAVAGMESSLAVFLVALTAVSTPGSWTWGVALALLALTRPETGPTVLLPLFVAHAFAAIRRDTGQARRWLLVAGFVVAIGSTGLALVAALRGWTNPLPTALQAKNATYALVCGQSGTPLASRIANLSALIGVSTPIAPRAVGVLGVLTLTGAISWHIVRRRGPADEIGWGIAWLATVFFQTVIVHWSFAWYYVVGGSIALLLVSEFLAGLRTRDAAVALVAVASLLLAIDLFAARSFRFHKLQTALAGRTSEFTDYTATGTLIRKSTPDDARIMLEPAGLVPFFAARQADDTIGLISDRVTNLVRHPGECWFDLAVDQLKPDVIVLRAKEVRTNEDFICGYRNKLSCRSASPVPVGYQLMAPLPAADDGLAVLARGRLLREAQPGDAH